MAAALALTQVVRGVCLWCVRIRAKHHAGRHGPVSPCEHSQAALTARQARAAAAAQRTSGPEPCALSVRAVAPLGSCFAVFARPARTAAQRLSAAALLGQVRHCSGVVVCATRAESADSVRSVRCDTAGAAAPQPLSAVCGLKRSLRHGTAVAIPSHTGNTTRAVTSAENMRPFHCPSEFE